MSRHEITLYLHHETDKAWMVNESNLSGRPPTPHVFLPKSQCEEVRRLHHGLQGTQITLDVPMWLIEKNDLENLV